MKSSLKRIDRTNVLWTMSASSVLAIILFATPALSADAAPLSMNPAARSAASSESPPGENNQGGYADPLSGFNEPMFTFNLKVDDWVLHPVASGYADIAPQPVRESVGRFFDKRPSHPAFRQQPVSAQAGRGRRRSRPLRYQHDGRSGGLVRSSRQMVRPQRASQRLRPDHPLL